jgi:hypothetical protein
MLWHDVPWHNSRRGGLFMVRSQPDQTVAPTQGKSCGQFRRVTGSARDQTAEPVSTLQSSALSRKYPEATAVIQPYCAQQPERTSLSQPPIPLFLPVFHSVAHSATLTFLSTRSTQHMSSLLSSSMFLGTGYPHM